MTSGRFLRVLIGLLLVGPSVAACGGEADSGSGGPVAVVAAFYPLEFVVGRVGGDRVQVTGLTKPGAEPHDLELEPAQRKEISRASLAVYLAGFQPAVDEAIEQGAAGKAFDVAAVEPLRAPPPGAEDGTAKDPHVWLDPMRLATIADRLADRLAGIDSGHAADFRAGAAKLRADLTALDAEYAKALGTCQRREIVTSHAAFGYLAARYRLEQIAITGLSPEDEPTPQRLAEIARLAKEKGVTTIFFETLVSPKIAETLAREVGAKAAVLDPIEGLEPDSHGDYLSVMRSNLAALKAALGCS